MALWAALAAPAWADGQLVVKSQPRGAAVYVDGRPVGHAPLVLNVPAGMHQVQVHKQGYSPRTTQVKVVDALTTRAVLALERQDRGELRVAARPAGSHIYVDGRYVGAAPLYLRNLSPGSHRVVAVRDGYVRSVQSVQVVAGLTSTSFHALTLLPPEPVRVAEQPKPVQAAAPAPRRAEVRPERPSRPERAERPAVVREPAPVPVARVEKPARPVVTTPRQQPARVDRTVPPQPAAARPHAPSAQVPATPATPFAWPTFTLPTVSLPAISVPAIAWPSLSAPQMPALPLPSRRELPFLGGMALLLGTLGAYYVRKFKRGSEAVPVLFPARTIRGPLPSTDDSNVEAAAAFRRGHPETAYAALWEAVQAGTGTAWHYYHLGLLSHQTGRPLEAENAYRTALQLDPGLPEAGYNLAVLLTECEQAPQAIMAYRKLLDAHPDHVDALFNLGHVYLTLGMHQQAWVHWTAARKLAPKDAQLRANVKFLHRLMRVQRKMDQRAAQAA